MAGREFHPQLWEEDIIALTEDQRDVARGILTYVRDVLKGAPYHRASRPLEAWRRQTLVKHPKTGLVCLIISVITNKTTDTKSSLRLDFFDEHKTIVSELVDIKEAPGKQWTEKGERRFHVVRGMSLERLSPLLAEIWNIAV